MSSLSLFSTQISTGLLATKGLARLNTELEDEARKLAQVDAAGIEWSAENYPSGYTSYSSMSELHRVSSTFRKLEGYLRPHVNRMADRLDFDLAGRKLEMTQCWVNVNAQHAYHGLHLHPIATISGTYYVTTPKGSGPIKFEDPRLGLFMARPPLKSRAHADNKPFVSVAPKAGHFVLFESWLRHEVVPNRTKAERISVSFNWNWF